MKQTGKLDNRGTEFGVLILIVMEDTHEVHAVYTRKTWIK